MAPVHANVSPALADTPAASRAAVNNPPHALVPLPSSSFVRMERPILVVARPEEEMEMVGDVTMKDTPVGRALSDVNKADLLHEDEVEDDDEPDESTFS